MKGTVFALSLLAIILITNAMETTEEDHKQQQSESLVMARSTARKVKRATTKAPVVADNKKCNCSPVQ